MNDTNTEKAKKDYSHLLGKTINWAEEQESYILQNGSPLSSEEIKLAETVGVKKPESVRVCEVPSLPLPDDNELKEAALYFEMLGPNMIGLTLGYGVFICAGKRTKRLVSHELRHVHQYEEAGDIKKFLLKYLEQLMEFGYSNAPLEIDARRHEQK